MVTQLPLELTANVLLTLVADATKIRAFPRADEQLCRRVGGNCSPSSPILGGSPLLAQVWLQNAAWPLDGLWAVGMAHAQHPRCTPASCLKGCCYGRQCHRSKDVPLQSSQRLASMMRTCTRSWRAILAGNLWGFLPAFGAVCPINFVRLPALAPTPPLPACARQGGWHGAVASSPGIKRS